MAGFALALNSTEVSLIFQLIDSGLKFLGIKSLRDAVDMVIKLEQLVFGKTLSQILHVTFSQEQIDFFYNMVDAAIKALGIKNLKDIFALVTKFDQSQYVDQHPADGTPVHP